MFTVKVMKQIVAISLLTLTIPVFADTISVSQSTSQPAVITAFFSAKSVMGTKIINALIESPAFEEIKTGYEEPGSHFAAPYLDVFRHSDGSATLRIEINSRVDSFDIQGDVGGLAFLRLQGRSGATKSLYNALKHSRSSNVLPDTRGFKILEADSFIRSSLTCNTLHDNADVAVCELHLK